MCIFVPYVVKLRAPTMVQTIVVAGNTILKDVNTVKRRSKTRTVAIHMTIPVRILEDLDETLTYRQSRSKIITKLIQNYLEGNQVHIGSMTKKQIIVNLINQTDPESSEYVLLTSLLQIFAKSD